MFNNTENPHSDQAIQAKQQMARNIVQAYTGRVTMEQVMNMDYQRVLNLHNEIIHRLHNSVK